MGCGSRDRIGRWESMTIERPSWQMKMTVPLEFGISTINISRMMDFYTEVLGLKIGRGQ